MRLLIAASGTGGHLFPAIATAEHLDPTRFEIEWLGVPDRLETKLAPGQYPLHTVSMGGLQGRGLNTLKRLGQLAMATLYVRKLLQNGSFNGVFTTGGYIAAPAIIAAKSLGLPTVLHESNALPGKVTRWLSAWCTVVALGFEAASSSLSKANSVVVGTPVRSQFLHPQVEELSDLSIPEKSPLIVIVGGSQGAVSVNQLVRQAAPAWFRAGAWVFHQTGSNDREVEALSHPQYIHRPFYDAMAPLLARADLAIGRVGAGTLAELAITRTPSILIPYPFAAEDHQSYNGAAFAAAGAAIVMRQNDLTATILQEKVLSLLEDPQRLGQMATAAGNLAIQDSAQQLADLIQKVVADP